MTVDGETEARILDTVRCGRDTRFTPNLEAINRRSPAHLRTAFETIGEEGGNDERTVDVVFDDHQVNLLGNRCLTGGTA